MAKKFFEVRALSAGVDPANGSDTRYSTIEEARNGAKRQLAEHMKANHKSYDWYITEAVEVAEMPVPDIKLTTLK